MREGFPTAHGATTLKMKLPETIARQRDAARVFPVHQRLFVRLYNTLYDVLHRRRVQQSFIDALNFAQSPQVSKLPIVDHLAALFSETLSAEPKLIVELGVEYGHSTIMFEAAAKIAKAKLVSSDINDCSDVTTWDSWTFVQGDDVAFGNGFGEWCRHQSISPEIDVLFIDTSHEYQHTVAEIQAWFPHLASDGKVMFHDTNMRTIYRRKDGTLGVAVTSRAVMRAVEEYLGTHYDESVDFTDYRNGWLVKHVAHCSGFLVMQRIEQT